MNEGAGIFCRLFIRVGIQKMDKNRSERISRHGLGTIEVKEQIDCSDALMRIGKQILVLEQDHERAADSVMLLRKRNRFVINPPWSHDKPAGVGRARKKLAINNDECASSYKRLWTHDS